MRPFAVAVASLACFAAAVAALSNQTPYCYTLQEFGDGRVEYREFSNNADAFAYTSSQGFWSDRPGVVNEESGCSSDKVHPWEATLGGVLGLAGFGIPIASARRGGAPAMLGAFAKTILGLATAFALVSLVSIGAFIAPWLIPFHWLAARRATRWMRGIWICAAAACAYAAGVLATWTLLRHDSFWAEVLPFGVAGLVVFLFTASTSAPVSQATDGACDRC
ncbi:MAG TPA: hypothetical protein VG929_04235 [Actinomycetota bacterium]|nr:hypothetical protein [Actinomycetota bacterium]